MSTVEELLLKYFRGRESHIALEDEHGAFKPIELTEPMRPSWLKAKHLSGKACLGFYLMSEGNTVLCSALDFDNKEHSPDPLWQEKASSVYYLLSNAGLHPVVEVSSSGQAAHVWLVFDTPVDAWLIRAFWKAVTKHLEIKEPEIYPRSSVHVGKGLGNLLRWPCWKSSFFPDVESEWEPIDPLTALEGIRQCDSTALKLVAWELGLGTLEPEQKIEVTADGTGLPIRVKNILNRDTMFTRRWNGDMTGMNDHSRSSLVQSLCVEMVRNYVPTPEIEQAIRIWGSENSYEKCKRDEWVTRSVLKSYDFVQSRQEAKSYATSTLCDAAHLFANSLVEEGEIFIPSGIEVIDKSIEGVGPGEVCIIGGRPGQGKSAIARQWCEHAASLDYDCLFISEEMSAKMIGKRALLTASCVQKWKWQQEDQQARLHEDIDMHYGVRKPVHLVEDCGTIDRVEEVIEQYATLYGVKFVVIDYLQLLSARGGNKTEQVGEVSSRVKKLTKRLNIHMLALAQLKRPDERQPDKEPSLSSLKDSGCLEQDADLVLLLKWPFKEDSSEPKDDYFVYCPKRRNGDVEEPRMYLNFDSSRQLFK